MQNSPPPIPAHAESVSTDGIFVRFFVDIAHRAGCVAILVVVLAPVVIAIGKPERHILAIAFGCALLAGCIGGAIWGMHHLSVRRRREGRGLAIMGAVVLVLTAFLMASPTLRSGLARFGDSILPPAFRAT